MTRGAALNRVKSAASMVRMVGVDAGKRQKDDFYPTPTRGTEALLSVERFVGGIWEPACGDGAISKILRAGGHEVVSSDLVYRGCGEGGVDFLMEYRPRAPNIVTNPPFKMVVPFVRRALDLTSGKVAMLLKLSFLEGVERASLFQTTPLVRVWVFSRRLTFVNTERGHVEGSGMMAFAWFVWDHSHKGPPTLGWV